MEEQLEVGCVYYDTYKKDIMRITHRDGGKGFNMRSIDPQGKLNGWPEGITIGFDTRLRKIGIGEFSDFPEYFL